MHSGTPAASFEALLGQYGAAEFQSPYRSTVALLAYWRDADARVLDFGAALGLALGDSAELHFEYQVPVQKGSGKPSCTDLMLRSGQAAVAIEAKATEPRYEDVATWLGGREEGNRWDVLHGWLTLLGSCCGRPLSAADVTALPYQLVHRAASACQPTEPNKWLVYHIFSANGADPESYRADLRTLKGVLGAEARLRLGLVVSEMHLTDRQRHLCERWTARDRTLSAEVEAGILAGDLLRFGQPEVTYL
jgi:hypothetical protein